MLSVQNLVLKFAVIVTLFFCNVGAASANTLGPNQIYSLSGNFSFTADRKQAGDDYWFAGTFKPASILQITTGKESTFNSVLTDIDLDFTIYKRNTQTGENGIQVGTASGRMVNSWSNVKYDAVHDVAGGNMATTGGAKFLQVSGNINNQMFLFSAPLMQMFATVPMGAYASTYDNAIAYIGNSFSMVLGNIGVGSPSALKGWLVGDAGFLCSCFHISGDIHAILSQNSVPEPGCLLLVSLGLLGGAVGQGAVGKRGRSRR